MAKKTGVVLGAHPVRQFFKKRGNLLVVDATSCAYSEDIPQEFVAAYILQKLGCDEIVLFACIFSNKCYNKKVESLFRALQVPTYQTLVGSGICLPIRELQEYIE